MTKRVARSFPLSESQDAFALLRLADDGCPNHPHIEAEGLASPLALIGPTGVISVTPDARVNEEAA